MQQTTDAITATVATSPRQARELGRNATLWLHDGELSNAQTTDASVCLGATHLFVSAFDAALKDEAIRRALNQNQGKGTVKVEIQHTGEKPSYHFKV